MYKNHQACFWRKATSWLPVSHFQMRLHPSTDSSDHTVQNQLRLVLVLADCVRFWSNGSSPEASQCAKIIRPASGQCFQANPDRIQHVYCESKSDLPVAHSGHQLKGRAVCEFGAATDACSASSECRCIALGLHCTIVFSACFIVWLPYLLSVKCSAASHSFVLV